MDMTDVLQAKMGLTVRHPMALWYNMLDGLSSRIVRLGIVAGVSAGRYRDNRRPTRRRRLFDSLMPEPKLMLLKYDVLYQVTEMNRVDELMSRRKYPWEMGTHLAVKIQAGDAYAARDTVLQLIGLVNEESGRRSFDETKLRVVQILSIACRAAYDAGADPEQLFHANLTLTESMIQVERYERLEELALRAVDEFASLVPKGDFSSAKKISMAIDYIRDHCSEEISREVVAEHVECSSSYLSTLFTKMTGHTFKEMVLKFRMERAKEILQQRDKTVAEVAFEVGYQDPNYFCATFKRVTGITPGQYRRKIPQPTAR